MQLHNVSPSGQGYKALLAADYWQIWYVLYVAARDVFEDEDEGLPW